MSGPAYLKNLRDYGGGDPSPSDIKTLEAEMYSGPDRAAAVVLSSLAERSLGHLLKLKMRKDGIGDLFNPDGMLGTFGAKIQIAYALKLIGPITRHDLNIIRTLRNQFAHSRKPIKFSTGVVKIACSHLMLPDQPGVFLNFSMLNKTSRRRLKAASDKKHPRTRFFTACNEIAQRIYFVRTGDPDDPLNQLP